MDEEAIFSAAVKKTTPQQRTAFLDEACGDDCDLRARVEGLLQAADHPNSFFDATGGQVFADVDPPSPPEPPGTMIGPYKLIEQIGDGGMGVVYLAEQKEPVERRVALKIIKPGMDSRRVISRFEAERQALAMMELVRGPPITDYCDQAKVDMPGRLELFAKVCLAVQHAHQKGVIHRDIKPSNVMVTMHDGSPVPKVIDFGVAKAINQRLSKENSTSLFLYFDCLTSVRSAGFSRSLPCLDVSRYPKDRLKPALRRRTDPPDSADEPTQAQSR